MKALWITLAVIGGLLFLFLCLLFFGKAKIRIRCAGKLRVVASVCGIPFTLVSDKPKKEPKLHELSGFSNPDRILKRELKRQKKAIKLAKKKAEKLQAKAARKAEKKRLAAQQKELQPTPNIKENLEMILALLKKLRESTTGKIGIRVKRLHIRVATGDAAQTAILYGLVMQSATFLLDWIDRHFNQIERREGAILLIPDYPASKTTADIDITCSIYLSQALGLAVKMLSAYRREKAIAKKKARARREKASENA